MKPMRMLDGRPSSAGLQRLNVLRPFVAPGRRGMVILGIFWSPDVRYAYKASHFVRAEDGSVRRVYGAGFASTQAATSAGISAFVGALRETIRAGAVYPEAGWFVPDPKFLE